MAKLIAMDLKKTVPVTLAFIMGIFGAFAYFYYTKPTADVLANAIVFDGVMGSMAMGISLINISLIHGRNVQRKRKGWFFSLLLLAVMYFGLIIGLGAMKPFIEETGTKVQYYGLFDWGTESIGYFLVNAITNPASTTVFSLLAFYIASAAYRTFRIRGIDSALLLISGSLVLLGQAPIGSVIFGPGIGTLRTWILSVPNMAGSRGCQIGIAIGAIAMSIRVLFGYERKPTLGGMG